MSILQILEVVGGGGGLLIALMTLVQFAPVKINPWSSLAKIVKNALYADISKRLNGIETKLDAHITTDDRRTADAHRARSALAHTVYCPIRWGAFGLSRPPVFVRV